MGEGDRLRRGVEGKRVNRCSNSIMVENSDRVFLEEIISRYEVTKEEP